MNPLDFDEFHEIAFRLGMATVLGVIMGIDRDLRHKPAGVRVLAMVALGAALATLASNTAVTGMTGMTGAAPDGALRTVQGILGGIGFLGAGVIMRRTDQDDVHGITTAACIWVAAVLGITSGLGQWLVTGTAFGLAMTVLIGGRRLESWLLECYGSPPDGTSSPGK